MRKYNKTSRCCFLLILGLFVIVSSEVRSCTSIRINGSDIWKPISFRRVQDGAFNGIMIDVAKKVFGNLGIDIHFESNLPWKRILSDLKANNIDMVVGAYATKQREQQFVLSYPVMKESVHIFVHPDNLMVVNALSDLDNKTGVRFLAASYGAKLDEYLKKHPGISVVRDPEVIIQLVARKRVDFAVASLFTGLNKAYELKLGEDVVPIFPRISTNEIYFLFSPKSSCLKKITAINNEIKTLISNGYISSIKEKYIDDLKLSNH